MQPRHCVRANGSCLSPRTPEQQGRATSGESKVPAEEVDSNALRVTAGGAAHAEEGRDMMPRKAPIGLRDPPNSGSAETAARRPQQGVCKQLQLSKALFESPTAAAREFG